MNNMRTKIFVYILSIILCMGIKYLDDKIINKEQKEFEYDYTQGNFRFMEKTREYNPNQNKICYVLSDPNSKKGIVLASYKKVCEQGIYKKINGKEAIGYYSARRANKGSTIIIQFVGYTDVGSAQIEFYCAGSNVSVTLDETPKMYCIPISISEKRPIGDFIISIIDNEGTINLDTLLVVDYDKIYDKSSLLIGEYLYK